MSRWRGLFLSVFTSVVVVSGSPTAVYASTGVNFSIGSIFEFLLNFIVNSAKEVARGGIIDQGIANSFQDWANGIIDTALGISCGNSQSLACQIARDGASIIQRVIGSGISPERLSTIAYSLSQPLEERATNLTLGRIGRLLSSNNPASSRPEGATAVTPTQVSSSYGSLFTPWYSMIDSSASRMANLVAVEAFLKAVEEVSNNLKKDLEGQSGPPKAYSKTVGELRQSDLLRAAQVGRDRVYDGQITRNEYEAYKGIADILLAHARISVAGHTYLGKLLQYQMVYNLHLAKTQSHIYQQMLENQAKANRELARIHSALVSSVSPSNNIVMPVTTNDENEE